MSFYLQFYYKLLSSLLRMLVKSETIPENPIIELGIDDKICPIVYVLLCKSKIDLLILRTKCLEKKLPDPLKSLMINGIQLPRYLFIYGSPNLLSCFKIKEESIKLFHHYLNLHMDNAELNIQIVFVSVMFGRHPGRRQQAINQILNIVNTIKKIFSVLFFGRDSFIRFSSSISLRWLVTEYGIINNAIVQKFIRAARMYFSRQYLATVGPRPLERQNLFNKLLISRAVSRAIADEAKSKKISNKQAKENAIKLMKEITANFSYEMVRLADRVLRFAWNRLYKKINVKNTEQIRQLAYHGHEIIYIPCHRSHMDYLLLSYILYHHGLALPYIAAGINLNFWPMGLIFRRLGAFFIRRTFKSNKLYAAIFREYLSELFHHGCAVGYFIEGGRSRTGRLLDPKTGTLSVTVQTMLKKGTRPITLVPIYIGYEHVVEIKSYTNELYGMAKKRENLFQMLYGLKQLCNLGQGYINFGEPLSLTTWLNTNVPEWRKSVNTKNIVRPIWFIKTVNKIADDLMIRINNASAMNAINLCCTALLASHHRLLTRKQLTEQLDCYLSLMKNVPYSVHATFPTLTSSELLDYAIKMKKFKVKKNKIGDFISLTYQQTLFSIYYRNNIAHMLVLPSLIATIVFQCCEISYQEMLRYIYILYPMFKSELFLHWNGDTLIDELSKLIKELLRQELIVVRNSKFRINPMRFCALHLLAANVQEMLQRYAIIFWLLSKNKCINRHILEKESRLLARKISTLYGINAPEFSEKAISSTLALAFRHNSYLQKIIDNSLELSEMMEIYLLLAKLIAIDVRLIIEDRYL